MPDRIVIAHGTSDEWSQETLPLALAEPGLDTDTGELKFGDGSSLWAALPAFTPVQLDQIAIIDDSAVTDLTSSGRTDATLSSQAIVSLITAAIAQANDYADKVASLAGGPRWVPLIQNADGTWPTSQAGDEDGTLAVGYVGLGTAPVLPKATDIVQLRDLT